MQSRKTTKRSQKVYSLSKCTYPKLQQSLTIQSRPAARRPAQGLVVIMVMIVTVVIVVMVVTIIIKLTAIIIAMKIVTMSRCETMGWHQRWMGMAPAETLATALPQLSLASSSSSLSSRLKTLSVVIIRQACNKKIITWVIMVIKITYPPSAIFSSYLNSQSNTSITLRQFQLLAVPI